MVTWELPGATESTVGADGADVCAFEGEGELLPPPQPASAPCINKKRRIADNHAQAFIFFMLILLLQSTRFSSEGLLHGRL